MKLLIDYGADIKKRGPDQKTALEIAIEKDQREVIESIIESAHWKEAFKLPCSSNQGKLDTPLLDTPLLDTPLRMLIRQIPDLAERVLDNCCERETVQVDQSEDSEKKRQDIIKMNFELIEDTNNYTFDHSKDQFVPTDKYDYEQRSCTQDYELRELREL